MPKSPKGKPRSKSLTPVPPPKAKAKSKKKPRRKNRLAGSTSGSAAADDVIDLTGFDDGNSDEEAAVNGSSASTGGSRSVANETPVKPCNSKGESLFRSLLDKGKQREAPLTPSSPAVTPDPSTPAPRYASAFTPLARSVISGLETPLSPSPPRMIEIEMEEGEIDEAGPSASAHFDPPALFGSVLAPIGICAAETGAEVKLAKPDVEGDKGELLLPAHVVTGETEDVEDEDRMEGVHVVDDDRSKGVPRYFIPPEPETEEAAFLANADQRQICRNCKRPGHKEADCPHVICTTCGKEDDHDRRDCPMSMVCFSCGQRGHRKATCPLLWRIYTYLSNKKRRDVHEDRKEASGWTLEAIGGEPAERWCYNCAKEGHFGDVKRGSLGRPVTNSAFSNFTATRGPFPSEPSSRRAGPSGGGSAGMATHTRFSDDAGLPDVVPGFQGGAAGRKTREKQRERARRDAMDDEGDGEDGWFRPKSAPRSEGRLPFGHSHFLGRPASAGGSAPPKPITVGRFAMLFTPQGSPSPLAGRGVSIRGRGGTPARDAGSPGALGRLGARGRGAASLPARPSPLGRGGANGVQRGDGRGRRQKDVNERDWENEWRRDGRGGGNVADWGRQMDGEAREGRRMGKVNADERIRAGPVRGRAGTPRGGREGGAAAQRGQKYSGGY